MNSNVHYNFVDKHCFEFHTYVANASFHWAVRGFTTGSAIWQSFRHQYCRSLCKIPEEFDNHSALSPSLDIYFLVVGHFAVLNRGPASNDVFCGATNTHCSDADGYRISNMSHWQCSYTIPTISPIVTNNTAASRTYCSNTCPGCFFAICICDSVLPAEVWLI